MSDVTFEDLTRAIQDQAPDFADRVVALLEQADPPEDRPENADDDQEWPPLSEETWTLAKLRSALSPVGLAEKTATERKNIRREAFEGLLAAPHPPPRFRLGALLIALYEEDDEWGRAHLVDIFKRAKLGFGIWRAFKTIYKTAERRHDAGMIGVLAYRLDAYAQTPHTGEIGPGTIIYLRRRAWRYLRQLGAAVPDLFPLFAVQVLKHYPERFRFNSTWVANQIWAHENLIGESTDSFASGPPENLRLRAFDEAWKISPDPLLRLLEDADNDSVCDFAIRGLKEDFPDRLRNVDAGWLKRIGRKSSSAVHTFVVEALTANPEFHQSRLRDLGLHRTVLDLLRSSSEQARAYAVQYAHAHAPDIDIKELIALVNASAPEVRQLATARLGDRSGAEIGIGALVTLVGTQAGEFAMSKLQSSFEPHELSLDDYRRLAIGDRQQRSFVTKWYEAAKLSPPVEFLLAVVEHEDADHRARRAAFAALDKRDGTEIGIDWFKRAVVEPSLEQQASRWLRQGKLRGDDLDVEWVKGMFMRPSLRALAIDVLGNRNYVEPSRVGLSWLLAMVRHPDEAVQTFAHRFLLEHFSPDDFGGIDRVWAMVSARDEPDSVRRFAATYLRVHHPEIGPTTSEAERLGITARLTRENFGLARVGPLFEDERTDVRNFAVTIGRVELVRWGDRSLLFDLAGSKFREPRGLAADVLLEVGRPAVDPDRIPPEDWLDPVRIFALTESVHRGGREIALSLIGRHYRALGGASRLAWLMESPDREVRTTAVRLLWQRHRPLRTPVSWAPTKGDGPPPSSGRFESVAALQLFLRTVLYGLPPGRRARQDQGLPNVIRTAPASVAKKRLIEVVRDLAMEDRDFAGIVTPVLETFCHSVGKTEWQASLTAMVRIRRAHPDLNIKISLQDTTEAVS